MNAVYKFVLCVLRRIFKNDSINAPIAGFFAGLVSYMELKSRRELLTALMMCRVFDTTYNIADEHNMAIHVPYGPVLLYVLCNVPQQYCMTYE